MAMNRGGAGGGSTHVPGYQERDREVVDYRQFELQGTGLSFRGPAPDRLEPGGYLACIGAAQTFGCFCEHPFPALLQERLGLPVLNLGYGGAGPAFFLERPALLELVNRARGVVVQVMSARSESNARFESGGLEFLRRRSDGARLGAALAWRAELDGERLLPRVRAPLVRWGLRRVGRLRTRRLVAETRRNWIESYRGLAAALHVPKVLFWFSKRGPDYRGSYRTLPALFGEFPQLVNRAMVTELAPCFDAYVECISSRGSPQLLRSRTTGEPCRVDPGADRADLGGETWSHNRYYPSPQMHEDAAEALVGVVRRQLG
jgi:hypothetical protein